MTVPNVDGGEKYSEQFVFCEFWQTFMGEIMRILLKLFQKIEEDELSANFF